MSKGYPSMTALLGVAGDQNRDKIVEVLKGRDAAPAGRSAVSSVSGRSSAPAGSGPLGNLAGLLAGVGLAGVGGFLTAGLSEFVDRFTKGVHGETANSWIDHGPNRAITEVELERAIGSQTLAHLVQQAGQTRGEWLARLSRDLPSAIDRYAPDGRLPV